MTIRSEKSIPLPRAPQTKRGTARSGLQQIWEDGERLPRSSKLGIWWRHLGVTAQSLRRATYTSLLSILTIAVTMFLFGAFCLFLQNFGLLLSAGISAQRVSVFLKDEVSSAQLRELRQICSAIPGVNQITEVSKEQALQRFTEDLGENAALVAGLKDSNPLPPSIEVGFSEVEPAVISAAVARIKKHPAVLEVRGDQSVIGNLAQLVRSIRSFGLLGSVLLLLMVLFIIASTIRLALQMHRSEIVIMQLVGADRGFIFAPFLLEGALKGLCGTLLSIMALSVVWSVIEGELRSLAMVELLQPSLSFPSLWIILLMLIAGVAVGVFASFISLSRFSRELEF